MLGSILVACKDAVGFIDGGGGGGGGGGGAGTGADEIGPILGPLTETADVFTAFLKGEQMVSLLVSPSFSKSLPICKNL